MNASPFQLLDARQKELETQLAWVDAVEAYGEASIALGHLLAGGSPMPGAQPALSRPATEAATGSAH
jgi:outer membrane protein TolC